MWARAPSRPRWRCWPPSRARRSSSYRPTAGATSPASSRRPAVGFRPDRVHPGVWAMAMDTEASLRSTCGSTCGCPCRAHRADGQGLRLRGHGRARGEGDPHHRQGLLGGPRGDRGPGAVGPRHRRRPRHRPRRRPARAPQAIGELVTVGPVSTQTGWMGDLLADPAVTALNVVTTPEEMPVDETIQLVGRVRADPVGAPRGGRREPGAARAVHPGRRGRLRGAAPNRPGRRPRGRAGPAPAMWSTAAALAVTLRRTRAAHLAHLREAVELPARSTCPSCSSGPRACGSPGCWPTPSARSWPVTPPPGGP